MTAGRRAAALRPVLFWLLIAALMFVGLGRGLWTPDEPREAEIGREMRLDPGFVPHLNGKAFFEKPPLYYWFVAGAYAVGGTSEAAARAVSGLFGLATIVALFFWARRMAGPRAACTAAFLLATSAQFFQSTHWVLLDPALMFFVTVAVWGAWEALDAPTPRLISLVMLYGGLSLAVWTKGLIGLALPAAGLGLFVALQGRSATGMLRRFRPLIGVPFMILFIGLCLGVFYLAEGREALVQLVWVNHVLRFVRPSTTGHAQPFYYYAQTLPVAVLPWLIPLLAVFRPSFWQSGETAAPASNRRFLACLAGGGVLLLSMATTKRETYLLPILPPLALLLALALEEVLDKVPEKLTTAERWLFCRIQPILLSIWGIALPLSVGLYTKSPRPAILLLGAVGLLAGIAGVRWGLGGDLRKAWEAHRASAAVLCISAVFLAVPVMEPQKNLAPFARWTGLTVPGKEPIPALGADETLCGIIPFTTGRMIDPLPASRWGELAAAGKMPPFVLEQRGAEAREYDLPKAGYTLLREQRFGTGRSLRLWKRTQPTEPEHP